MLIRVDGRRVICVYSKCGATTLKTLAAARGWPEISVSEVDQEPVYCMLRHPVHRLFSTFRMFYLRDYAHPVYPGITDWRSKHAREIREDPIRIWRKWLASGHMQELLEGKEGHVRGYAWYYNHVRKNCANCEFRTNLTRLMQVLALPLVHEHVGRWPWPARTLDDFVQAAGRVPHLDADFELWNAHK